jgi:transposase
LDESGYYVSSARRVESHSLGNDFCSAMGLKARALPHYSVLVAIDARRGVINKMLYPHGTTAELFLHFVIYLLIPSLAGTGRRVITMNRLNAHYGDVVDALRSAGHFVVFRPASSPTFGPVEWVFSYVDKFLQQHSTQVNAQNLKKWIVTCFNTVTKDDVTNYMSKAHFFVPGHRYAPYAGEKL